MLNEASAELPLKERKIHPPGQEAQAGVQHRTSGAGVVGVKLDSGWAQVTNAALPRASLHLPVAGGTLPCDLLSQEPLFPVSAAGGLVVVATDDGGE